MWKVGTRDLLCVQVCQGLMPMDLCAHKIYHSEFVVLESMISYVQNVPL